MPGRDLETTEVVIIVVGHAGIAISEHLRGRGVPHLVLKKNRIAEAWQSRRWHSLVANGPAWHDRFPTQEFADVDPDGFATKNQVAEYFRTLVVGRNLPVRTGVTVIAVTEQKSAPGYRVETDSGVIEADYVVAAGSSGVQIAAEIQKSGRKVYLAVGPYDRPPRAYRNRDFCWWLGALGKWDLAAQPVGAEHVTIAARQLCRRNHREL